MADLPRYEMEKLFGGCNMSTVVLHNKNLSSTAKIIHCQIINCFHKKDYCSLSNKQIADIFGLSKATVSIKISELIRAGYLKSYTVQVEAFPGADYTIAERRLSW